LVNVYSAGGIRVTRNFPPRLPEDRDPGYTGEAGIIHPVMHPGIWIGFGDLDGQDYWRLKAQVKHDGFVQPPQADGSRASFTVRNCYLSEDGQREVCQDVTRYAKTWVRRGEPFKLSYGVAIHDGATPKLALPSIYLDYVASAR
jgi:hypothetical protein